MRCYFFAITIFVAVVDCQIWDKLYFSQDARSLSRCIEALFESDELFVENEIKQTISNFAGTKFSGKAVSNQDIKREIKSLLDILKNGLHRDKNEKFWKNLEVAAENAVIDCSFFTSRFNDRSSRVELPFFSDEPDWIREVLNFILVDWTAPLRNMIRTRDGRSELRSYADSAQVILECALRYARSLSDFRAELRSWWLRRAERYFDGRDSDRLHYLTHRFDPNGSSLYTYAEDMSVVLTRNCKRFRDRNPRVWSPSYLERILSIHCANPHSEDETNIFDYYRRYGMSIAEYYLEDHIIQFYRILFFFLELRARGITSDEDDIFDEPFHFYIVPKKIQVIVYADDVYRNYLSRYRCVEENLFINLVGNENYLSSVMKNNVTTSTTTTSRPSSTQKYDEKRKGSICKNMNGKHFVKIPRTSYANPSCNGQDKLSDTKDINNYKSDQNRRKENGRFFGYILQQSSHPNQLLLDGKESSVLMEMLKNEFALLGGSQRA